MTQLKPNPILSRPVVERRLTTMLLRLKAVDRNGDPQRHVDPIDDQRINPQLSNFQRPPVQHTLSLAESIHRALVRKAAKGQRINCPELTGHELNGQPLSGPHQHAHLLPIDLDLDGLLDHLVIHAPMGLGCTAQSAITQLKVLYKDAGAPWLTTKIVHHSHLDHWFRPFQHTSVDHRLATPFSFTDRVQDSNHRQHRSSIKQGATDWVSLTPFVPPRYVKKSGKNSLAGQVNAELGSRLFPNAEFISCDPWPTSITPWQFRRRADHAQPPQSVGFRIHLRFAQPVAGPICLGYASHFGLGVFRAID